MIQPYISLENSYEQPKTREKQQHHEPLGKHKSKLQWDTTSHAADGYDRKEDKYILMTVCDYGAYCLLLVIVTI